jgi:hypothetical protein
MPEIGMSGLMSGDRKRSVAIWPKPPRLSSTLHEPLKTAQSLHFTVVPLSRTRAGFVEQAWRMSRRLKNAGWIAAFVALCAIWGHEVMHAVRQQSHPHANTGVWICPILGNCGPAGTPGLGRW